MVAELPLTERPWRLSREPKRWRKETAPSRGRGYGGVACSSPWSRSGQRKATTNRCGHRVQRARANPKQSTPHVRYHHQIVLVLEGNVFTDGVLQNAA
jgi:hypothetical protein